MRSSWRCDRSGWRRSRSLRVTAWIPEADHMNRAIAVQGAELELGKQAFTPDAVHDLQILGPSCGRPLEPRHEGVRLLPVAQAGTARRG